MLGSEKTPHYKPSHLCDTC